MIKQEKQRKKRWEKISDPKELAEHIYSVYGGMFTVDGLKSTGDALWLFYRLAMKHPSDSGKFAYFQGALQALTYLSRLRNNMGKEEFDAFIQQPCDILRKNTTQDGIQFIINVYSDDNIFPNGTYNRWEEYFDKHGITI